MITKFKLSMELGEILINCAQLKLFKSYNKVFKIIIKIILFLKFEFSKYKSMKVFMY